MKITIDTKQDSHEEIKHAIQILTNILQRQGARAAPTADTSNMMSMFGDSPSTPTSPSTAETQPTTPMSMFADPQPRKEVPDTPPDFSTFLNLAQGQQVEKKEPKVEYF